MALVLTSLVMGCPGPDPSDEGTYVYDGYGTIERDPACKLTGNLQLSLGEGDGTDFTPLAPGQEPVVYHGPQGGSHLILGVSVANPATEFPGLQVQFLLQRQRCTTAESCLPPETMGRDERLVNDPQRFLPQEGGAVSVSGILVLLGDWDPAQSRRIQVQALDRCGRAGVASLELGPPGSWP
ncbi:hypothetical protein NR798_21325 [Archangium gephyra]|uniref:hypothetical protein n=1 Tax=Archangium gephyra TaxID=48 RepID=UPI0035D3FDB7